MRPTLWKCLNIGRIRQAFWKVFLDFHALLSKRKEEDERT
nr:MAG TPA: Keratinocyte differentiation-associated [Caudoviricetes sp.]